MVGKSETNTVSVVQTNIYWQSFLFVGEGELFNIFPALLLLQIIFNY